MRDLLAAVVLFCAQYDKGNYPAVTAFSGFQKKYPDVVRRHFFRASLHRHGPFVTFCPRARLPAKVFHGILIDPDEAKCMKFLTSKVRLAAPVYAR